MNRFTFVLLALVFAMGTPMAALADSCCPTGKHGKQDAAMGHDSMGEQKNHEMHGDGFVTIGEETEKEVKAVAKIIAYDAEKVAMIKATHHLMVYFTDAKSGAAITSGKVALKIKGSESTSKPMMLMSMGDGFGTDLRIDKGTYDFEVGSKLADGKKRQFGYAYTAN